MNGKERPTVYLMCQAKFISLVYLVWTCQLQGISIGSALTTLYGDSINTTAHNAHYKLSRTKSISWYSVVCTKYSNLLCIASAARSK